MLGMEFGCRIGFNSNTERSYLCNIFCLCRFYRKGISGMKKWIVFLWIFLLLQSLSGCMLSTVDDLSSKEETVDLFLQRKEAVCQAVEELQDLWEQHSPHSISVSLENTKVYATIYHFAEDGYHLNKTKLELESENIRALLGEMAKDGISMDEDGIDFQCDGAGFGPNTAYAGIFYAPTKNISSIPFITNGAICQPDQDYFCSDRGDNEVEIERVEGGFFYYRLRY